MKTLSLAVIAIVALSGCHSNGVDRLLGNTDGGTLIQPEKVTSPDANAVPVYDQASATAAQDLNLIKKVIGNPEDAIFAKYAQEPILANTLNGKFNGIPGSAISSILVDAFKAMFRLGYCDVSKLNDASVLQSNSYLVPVYQDSAERWKL